MPDLSLPQGQDAVISAVTAANPKTVVVLETGGPVLMPWLDKAAAVLEAWYPGGEGGQAIADVLFGDVDASGRLPLTFPASQGQYPREALPGLGLPQGKPFDVTYSEGADVGYRRFAKTGDKPLFPFGYGLSYTSFGYSDLKVTGGSTLTVSFKVTNTGTRDGKAAPQLYLKSIAAKPEVRLIGFDKLSLKPGETRTVTLKADPRLLARFDAAKHNWSVAAGEYQVAVGRSSADFVLNGAARVSAQTIKP
jgi:beta-glucosidase